MPFPRRMNSRDTAEGAVSLRSHEFMPDIVEALPEPLVFHPDHFNKDVGTIAGHIKDILQPRRHFLGMENITSLVPKDEITFKAVGWLIQEGHIPNKMFEKPAQPNQQDISQSDSELVKRDINDAFVVPGAPAAVEANEVYAAYKRAVEFGMYRRQQTMGEQVYGEDASIGERAGVIIRSIIDRTPALNFKDIVSNLWKRVASPELETINPTDKEFMAAAAIGWLAATNDIAVQDYHGLKVSLSFGRHVEYEESPHIKQHADVLAEHIRKEGGRKRVVSLVEEDEGKLLNAVALGYLLRQNRVEIKQEKNVVWAQEVAAPRT